jgi:hypothetical protein
MGQGKVRSNLGIKAAKNQKKLASEKTGERYA